MQTDSDIQRPVSTETQTPEQEEVLRVYTAAAELVRSDSQFKSKLTSAAALLELSGIEPEPQLIASKMAETSGCDDLKMIFAANGHAYFYSEHWFSRKDAERLVLGEEVRSQIADQVRQDSMTKAKLTSVDRLGMLIPGAEPDKIEGHLAMLFDDARYSDVKLVSNSKGTKYLYCADHMTATYAMVLSRAEANDPIGTIAATVRDESRIYPRPTRLEMFSAPVFNIDPSRIEAYAREIVEDAAYPDIKLAEASNGALYLYSDLYVDARWVRSTIEWEEVEQFSNP